MATATRTAFDVVPLSEHIGAEIRGLDLSTRPDAEIEAALYQAWLKHLVLVFPDQKLSQEDLLRVTAYFGEVNHVHRPPKHFPKGFSNILPNIMMISNIRENGEPIGALPDGEMLFHHDMIHAEVPSKATLLYAVEMPSAGGDTLFASGYAAYEALDAKLRERLEGRQARHVYNFGEMKRGDAYGTGAVVEMKHPVFRTHEDTETQGALCQPADDNGHRRPRQGGERRDPGAVVRSDGAAAVRLWPQMAGRRPLAVGQPLLHACTYRLLSRRAAVDAAHDGEGDGEAVLMRRGDATCDGDSRMGLPPDIAHTFLAHTLTVCICPAG